jgi:hypothetical protein
LPVEVDHHASQVWLLGGDGGVVSHAYGGAADASRRQGKSAKWTLPDPERQFRDYLSDYAESDTSKFDYLLRHPLKSVNAAVAVRRLPLLKCSPSSNGVECDVMRSAMRWMATPFATSAVLMLPSCPDDFGKGASNQTLRRKVRLAQRLGVKWMLVDDPAERCALLSASLDFERKHPLERYRNENAFDHPELLGIRLWSAAYASDGRPVLLAVTARDGEWALNYHFRSIGTGDEQSHARYLALYELGRHLAGTGVRYLFDTRMVSRTPEGLRHFQRMSGFRVVRLRAGT